MTISLDPKQLDLLIAKLDEVKKVFEGIAQSLKDKDAIKSCSACEIEDVKGLDVNSILPYLKQICGLINGKPVDAIDTNALLGYLKQVCKYVNKVKI